MTNRAAPGVSPRVSRQTYEGYHYWYLDLVSYCCAFFCPISTREKYLSVPFQASAHSLGHRVRLEAAKSYQTKMPISYNKCILPMFLAGSDDMASTDSQPKLDHFLASAVPFVKLALIREDSNTLAALVARGISRRSWL